MTFLVASLPPQTERAFMAQIVRYATLMGWRCHHTFDSRRSSAGVPDILAVRRPRVVWLETKSERGRLTAEQRAWLDDLRACGQEAHCVRPSQWKFVEALLR